MYNYTFVQWWHLPLEWVFLKRQSWSRFSALLKASLLNQSKKKNLWCMWKPTAFTRPTTEKIYNLIRQCQTGTFVSIVSWITSIGYTKSIGHFFLQMYYIKLTVFSDNHPLSWITSGWDLLWHSDLWWDREGFEGVKSI